ncbi:hypothetical protein RhiirA1_467093 [Rhizophagus irregularis]|uniref:AAA+ ATPase domain-containing protein n=1 Tax=Rhizophagus irregularis TaxID=588596 RepID=A0A2N0RCQ1_9GLOM|nr:hypothetical protein RhiirA1_467093 [Rhizophagus irregularis]CAB4488582.1 unnamed protein product [Rhizophagus irregularis]
MISNIIKCFHKGIIPSQFATRFLQLSKFNLKPNYKVQSSYPRYHTISFPNKYEKWKPTYFIQKKRWPPIQNYLHYNNCEYNNTSKLFNIILYGCGLIIPYGSLIYWAQSYKQHNIKILEKEILKEVVLPYGYISRPEVVEQIKKIFQPDNDHSYYHVIYGEVGTGKTTLVKKAIKEVGKGVIYIDIGEFERDQSMTLNSLKHIAEMYKAKYNKPPVIIYDNVEYLIHNNPEILDILQDDAKDSADNRKYIAVFVANEANVIMRMGSRSSWSCASVMEIGNFNEKESMEYLTKKRNINEVDAKKLYELVDSNFLDLYAAADEFLDTKSFEDIKKGITKKIERKSIIKYKYHEVRNKILKALLECKKFRVMDFFDNYEDAGNFLYFDIFAYHPESDNITFQYEWYIRENASEFRASLILYPGLRAINSWV